VEVTHDGVEEDVPSRKTRPPIPWTPRHKDRRAMPTVQPLTTAAAANVDTIATPQVPIHTSRRQMECLEISSDCAEDTPQAGRRLSMLEEDDGHFRERRRMTSKQRGKRKRAKDKAPEVEAAKEALLRAGPSFSEGTGAELRALLQQVDKLRRQMETAGDGWCTKGGSSGGGRGDAREKWSPSSKLASFPKMMRTSRKTDGRQKKSNLSSGPGKSGVLETYGGQKLFGKTLDMEDPLRLSWADVRDVPKMEVNRLGSPSGAFWNHMRPYVFNRGAYVFPWHLNWNEQCPELKEGSFCG
jgi:hypothetical protein